MMAGEKSIEMQEGTNDAGSTRVGVRGLSRSLLRRCADTADRMIAQPQGSIMAVVSSEADLRDEVMTRYSRRAQDLEILTCIQPLVRYDPRYAIDVMAQMIIDCDRRAKEVNGRQTLLFDGLPSTVGPYASDVWRLTMRATSIGCSLVFGATSDEDPVFGCLGMHARFPVSRSVGPAVPRRGSRSITDIPALVSIPEVVRLTGFSYNTIRGLNDGGAFGNVVRVGRSIRLHTDSVLEYFGIAQERAFGLDL